MKTTIIMNLKFKLVLRWMYSSLHAFSIQGSAHMTFPLISELENRTLKLALALSCFNLRRPRLAKFCDIIKIATMLIKTTFEDSKK